MCKTIDVCAAVVFAGRRLMLATRKPGTDMAGQWEFPGGKVREGESLPDCIARELQEELGIKVTRAVELLNLIHQYPSKTIRLHFMWCVIDGHPEGLEGQRIGWFESPDLQALTMAPADRAFLEDVSEARFGEGVEVLEERTLRLMGRWFKGNLIGEVRLIQVKPEWLRVPLTGGKALVEMRDLLAHGKLHTICESGKCPNLCECWRHKTATFMILGDRCTRDCRFCAVAHGRPLPVDPEEPQHVAESVKSLGLRHAVLTCVTRDDLEDGGAEQMALTVEAIRRACPDTTVEVLVSDFLGREASIERVMSSGLRVYGHNLETVERMTPDLRFRASYRRSLAVLSYASEHRAEDVLVKSGLMLGVGETDDEVRQALRDLRAAGVDIVTLGQYLQPTPKHWPVERMVTPEDFKAWERFAEDELGFRRAICGPLVRSSYLAEEALKER